MANMGRNSELDITTDGPGRVGTDLLSVVVIGPDERRRREVILALEGPLCAIPQQLTTYPSMAQIARLMESNPDVVIVDLDSNPESALDVVENICATGSSTVMVFSTISDTELMIRCMRVGAREFLNTPIESGSMAEALVRASARRAPARGTHKAEGRLCVFWGAKGGSGVTTIATNFAIAAAQESGKKVVLIDLDVPLGDAVLNLGLVPMYSTVDALQNYARLDTNFL